jgi:GAF domain-containing protein
MSESVLDAAIRAAVEATGARSGWIVARGSGGLRVMAVAGDTDARVGTAIVATAPASLAAATGQPAARTIDGDERALGAGGSRGMPGALLTVPVGDGDGAIELADPLGGGPFSIDDIEVVSMLADVVAAALDEADGPTVPTPEELAAELGRLYLADRARYAFVAQVVSNLMGGS